MDLVWKPVNFIRQTSFTAMAKRCLTRQERPFAYCHFENIAALTTKGGLVKILRDYYSKSELFSEAGYAYEHTMAQSYFLTGGECFENDEVHKLRRVFNKLDKRNYIGEFLSDRQLKSNMWIMKPENENRGRGIEIISSYKQLLANLSGKIKGESFIL